MADDFNVIVVKRSGRKFLYLRYTCPVTGERIAKSSGETSEKEARKRAGEWEAELRAGGGSTKLASSWAEFRQRYEDGKAYGLRDRTAEKICSTFNVIESVMKPDSLKRITPQWLTTFQKRLLDAGRSPATVEGYCRHLKAAMNWARDQGILIQVPKFPKLNKVRQAKVMKGRPVTAEEFDRMIEATEGALRPDTGGELSKAQRDSLTRRTESFRFLLNGLWLSGLRLGEALSLTWDQWADGIRIDLDGRYAKLLIPAESEKGGQDRVYPTTPDFAEFLRNVPEDQRKGFVFNPMLHRGVCRRVDTVSKVICRIGQQAGVKVDQKAGEPVWASAHDLRRAFGFRWSRKVNSMVLKELMRHASVATTEKFYVGIQADETAAMLESLLGATSAENAGQGATSGATNKKGVPENSGNP